MTLWDELAASAPTTSYSASVPRLNFFFTKLGHPFVLHEHITSYMYIEENCLKVCVVFILCSA